MTVPLRVLSALSELPAATWDSLHDDHNPFVSHAFLCGLETHGCLRERWGWTPHHFTLWDDDTLVAAAPGYVKTNSHGEFVFDYAWARAYAHYGQDYYPKWICAVPYSPVTGPRLLARDDAARTALVRAIPDLVRAAGCSSAHMNFLEPPDAMALDVAGGWMARVDVQYHWRNPARWRDFHDFLAAMDHKHRKNIRQERAKVARAGVTFRVLHGDEACDGDLAAMHGFYLRTFAEYGNSPALTLDFLRHLAQVMPRQLVLILADHAGDIIAGALCLRGGETLYGRYWGAERQLPGLHFETCYYQGIEYCLREGLNCFEPGAQGEHKISRGFLPHVVRSRHWIADPRFAPQLAQWCADESEAVHRYAAQLMLHTPFREGSDQVSPSPCLCD
ncbi:MAG: N-acetyltransferase [Lysobacteraceae bacterium]|nr:MAG: N-acetyltransferase [Xanthomonadaceae bacterium]